MSRALDDLTEDFRPLVFELLARLVEQGIGVMVVDTLRTKEEHEQNIRNGASWTATSKHLPGTMRGLTDPGSDAIDLCPFDVYLLHGPDKLKWDADDPVWQRMGKIGESLGMRWGGRWRQKDLGHFELVR